MDLEKIAQTQRERLFHIDFRALFFGNVRRADLMRRFGLAEAAASRDLALYRSLAPENLTFDQSIKTYRAVKGFAPLFDHVPDRSLHALSEGIGDADTAEASAQLPVARPMRPASPSLDVVAGVSRAIHTRRALRITYHSVSSGASTRIIVPHALVDTSLRWHARAWDDKRQRFGDFVLTRITSVEDAGDGGELPNREADEQWMRIVPLEIVPHPGIAFPDTIAVDFGMNANLLTVRLRAPLVGYVLQAWGVDITPNHALDPQRHQLWLRNTATLYGVESLTFAPGHGVMT